MIRTGWGGGSAFRPREAGRWPQPTPLRPLSSRGRRGEAGAWLSVRLWGSQLRPPGPGLRLPGSCGSAPSCACAGAARYANCAGSNRGSATPRRARRVVVREWARATPPAGARGYGGGGRPGAGAAPHSAGAGWARPGAAGPHASLPHSQTETAPPGRGRQRLALARSLKKTSAHSQDGPRAPPSGAEPTEARRPERAPARRPRRARFPLTWSAARRAQSPPEPHGHPHGALSPSTAPRQSSCRGRRPAYLEAPQVARGGCPVRAVRGSPSGSEGPGPPGGQRRDHGRRRAAAELPLGLLSASAAAVGPRLTKFTGP